MQLSVSFQNSKYVTVEPILKYCSTARRSNPNMGMKVTFNIRECRTFSAANDVALQIKNELVNDFCKILRN